MLQEVFKGRCAWAMSSKGATIGQPDTLVLISNEGAVREVRRAAGDDGPLEVEVKVPVERSRWLALSAQCANGAMAHTTPVYVVLDGQPTWCVVNGPRVIQRKLEELAAIEKELASKPEEQDVGIIERVGKGKRYYNELRDRIAASAAR